MSENSRKTVKLETVDLIVSSYEWTCPYCGSCIVEDNFGLAIKIVQCKDCGDYFYVSDCWE